MRKSFLVGDFLPAYSDVFRYPPRTGLPVQGLSVDRLNTRFAQRAARHKGRGQLYLFRLQVGLAIAMILTVGMFRINLFGGDGGVDFSMQEQELVEMEEIVQTRQIERPPPPPRPPVPVEVPDDVDLADDDLDLDATLDMGEAIASLPPPPAEVVEEAAPEDEDELFVVVEEMPEMIGGMAALLKDLEYPEIARKAQLEGMVVVQVVIGADGTPSDPTIVKSVASVLDNAAMRAVMLQSFKPGRQRGRNVRVALNIPVVFRLT